MIELQIQCDPFLKWFVSELVDLQTVADFWVLQVQPNSGATGRGRKMNT
jgi:hypothetical protein